MKDVASGLLVAIEEKQIDVGFVGLAVGARVTIDFDDLRPLIETIAESAVPDTCQMEVLPTSR